MDISSASKAEVRVQDPRLQELEGRVNSLFEESNDALESVQDFISSVEALDQRRDDIDIPLPEGLQSDEHVDMLIKLGRSSNMRGDRIPKSLKDTPEARVVPVDSEPIESVSELSSILLHIGAGGEVDADVKAGYQEVVRIADAIQTDEPSYLYNDAKQIMIPIRRMTDQVTSSLSDIENKDTTFSSGIDLRAFTRDIQELPSHRTMEVITGLAFVDTVRGATGNVLQTKAKKTEIEAGLKVGAKIEDYRLYFAASMLDFAATRAMATGNELIKRNSELALTAGVKRMMVPALVARSGSFADSRLLSKHGRLLVNANDVMKELYSHDEVYSLLDPMDGFHMHLAKAKLYYTISEIDSFDNEFYKTIDAVVANGASDELIEQAIELERLKNAQVNELFEKITDSGILSRTEMTEVQYLLESRLEDAVHSQLEQEQLSELRELVDQKITELMTVEEPYEYRASRIRSFERGREFMRTLEQDLDKRNLLPSEETVHSLSMLILQSEQAEDKTAYFTELSTRRDVIESGLAELEFVGMSKEYKSCLNSALQWLDEVVDSGQDCMIGNSRLRAFLDSYYLGVDETSEPVPTDEPTSEFEQPTQEEQEPEQLGVIDDEPSPEQGEANTQGVSIVEKYIQTLTDILKNVDIEYADIDAFPPGRYDREARGRSGSQEVAFVDVDPARLENIVQLKKTFERSGKTARLMVTNPTTWAALPHFALYVQEKADDSTGVCLIESPINGNASYVYSVDGQLVQQWEDLARVSKSEARDFGATTFVHPAKGAQTFSQHYTLKLMSDMSFKLAALK